RDRGGGGGEQAGREQGDNRRRRSSAGRPHNDAFAAGRALPAYNFAALRLPFLPADGRRRMVLSLAVLGLGCALVMQSLGWAQSSYMAFSKALDHGTPQIDRWHWETRDKSYTGGHFYSVKAPGLPLMTLPLYALLHAVDAEKVAHDMQVTGAHGGK